MKKLMRTFALMAVAALGLSACTGEKLVPDNGNADGKFVTVHFGAEAAIEGATKATLTTEDEKTFKSAWENGDALSVKYSFDYGATKETTATWSADKSYFEAQMDGGKGDWTYDALYPAPSTEKKVDFGPARTQKGNAYNSKYDLMKGGAVAEGADAGKTAEGKDVVFNMERQTAIAYFHFTSTLDEEVVSAKLSVEGATAYLSTSEVKANEDYAKGYAFTKTEGVASKEINLTFDAGIAPKTSDFKLWFNVLPTIYDKMTLTVETANHTLTISRNATGMYEAGKLYKVVKTIPAEKWVKKGGETPEPTVYVWDLSINSTSEASENQIGWTNDAAYMLCVKGESTTAANNYYPGTSGKSYTSTRFYKNSTLSITPKVGKSLCYYVFEATSDSYAKALANSTWTNATASVDAANAKVVYIVATDPAEAVSAIIGGTCGFTKVECHKDALSLTPVIKPASTSITVPSNGGEQHITYTILYPEDGKALTAVSSETTWITSINCETAGTVSFVAEANEGAERTATITLSYPGAEDVVVDVKQGAAAATANDGSLAHPYTAAEAIAVIDSGTGLTGKYVKGIVKEVVSHNSSYGSMVYNIESGEKTLKIFNGYDFGHTKFLGTDDLKVGDEVVVFGDLYKYSTTVYELNTDNYLISINGKTEICRGLAVSGQKTAFTVDDAFEFGGKVLQVWRGKEDVDVTASATFSGYNMSTEGKQTVTVTVDEETVTYEITVNPAGAELELKTWTYALSGTTGPILNEDNPATVNGATWSITMGPKVGSPDINGTPTKSYNNYGWKWGNSSSKYWSSYTLSTDYFASKSVKSVTVNFLNNGKKSATMIVKQGETTIGTATQEFGTTWTDLTANTTQGTGGTLTINYSVAQASLIHSITVEYYE